MSYKHTNAYALYSTRNIKPLFKPGSLFIIDPDMPLQNETLVAIRLPYSAYTEIKNIA